jgi:iron complex transport system substrate-binding protein
MRICSLVPSATETLFAIGAGECVAGVTFECDFPAEALRKRVVVRTRLTPTQNPAEIDRQVNEFVSRGESLYEIDADALKDIKPELIITQDLCHVCAASPGDLASALAKLPASPKVLSLNPQSLRDVWDDIRRIGDAAGRSGQAAELVSELKSRVEKVRQAAARATTRPRVVCLEWLDPPFVAGHWVPEMVAIAGGADVLGDAARPGLRTSWDKLLAARPQVIVVMPCGYDLRHTLEEFSRMELPDGWEGLPAVRNEQVYAVDGSAYFSRPGPRLAGGVEILAGIIHPELAPGTPPPASVAKAARARYLA